MSYEAEQEGTRKKSLMLPMRLLCLLLAVILWLIVVNITSDNYEKTFVIDIRLEGITELAEKNSMSVYDQAESRVSVAVSGARSIIQELENTDFRAYIDVSGLTEAGKHSVPVKISVPDGVTLSSLTPEQVDIFTDTISSVRVPVEIDMVAYSVSYSYEVAKAVPAKSEISVTGPLSVLNRIKTAKALVDLNSSWLTASFDHNAPLSLYAEDGTVIASDYLVLSDSGVLVNVKVLRTTTAALNFASEPGADVSVISSVSFSPATLPIKAEEKILSEFKSLQVFTYRDDTPEDFDVRISSLPFPEGVEYRGTDEFIHVHLERAPVVTQPPVTEPPETEPVTTEPLETQEDPDVGFDTESEEITAA